MKKIISLLILIAPVILQAQIPDWKVSPQEFSNSMVMVGLLNLNGLDAGNEGDIVAAFVDGEVRGIASPVFDEDVNQHIVFMIIHGDSDEEELTFQVYDVMQDQIVTLANKEPFEINGIRGTVLQPIVWSERVLETKAEFTSFSIDGQVDVLINEEEVNLDVSEGTDLSQAKPLFTTSEGAMVFIGDQMQETGVSVVDLSSPVTYILKSEDRQTQREIKVIPNFVVVSSINNFNTTKFNLFPNPTTKSVTYQVTGDYRGQVLINIRDMNGKLLLSHSTDKQIGELNTKVNLSSLDKGLYLLEAYHGGRFVESVQVIKD